MTSCGEQMTDPIAKAVDNWLDDIVARDRAARAAVEAEIRSNGTLWAASEIVKLRERVASLEARVNSQSTQSPTHDTETSP